MTASPLSQSDILPSPALTRARATLEAGCRFLMARTGHQPPHAAGEHLRTRVTGNHLKELDRYLSVMTLAAADWLATMAPHEAGRRRHALAHVMGMHRPRLRAIRRVQWVACGKAQGATQRLHPRDLALTGGGGRSPALNATALGQVAAYYLAVGQDVAKALGL